MLALRSWLRAKCRVKKGQPANFASLSGGLYNVPVDERHVFYELYEHAIRDMTPERFDCYVFRPPTTAKQMFLLDIDLRFQTERDQDSRGYILLAKKLSAEIIARKLVDTVEFTVVLKKRGYYKQIKHGDGPRKEYALGAHLYFNNVSVDLSTSKSLREAAVLMVPSAFAGFDYINSDDDVCDFDTKISGKLNKADMRRLQE